MRTGFNSPPLRESQGAEACFIIAKAAVAEQKIQHHIPEGIENILGLQNIDAMRLWTSKLLTVNLAVTRPPTITKVMLTEKFERYHRQRGCAALDEQQPVAV